MSSDYQLIHESLKPIGVLLAEVDYKCKEGENFPDLYIVYSRINSQSEAYFSNFGRARNDLYRITFYTRNREILQSTCETIRMNLLKAGFLFVRFSPDIYHESGHVSCSSDFRTYHKEVN